MGYLEPQTIENIRKTKKYEISVLVAPKVGSSGGHPKVGGAENDLKLRKEILLRLKISSQSEQALKSY